MIINPRYASPVPMFGMLVVLIRAHDILKETPIACKYIGIQCLYKFACWGNKFANYLNITVCYIVKIVPDSNVDEADMRSTWELSSPGGPHVAPMSLAILGAYKSCVFTIIRFMTIVICHSLTWHQRCKQAWPDMGVIECWSVSEVFSNQTVTSWWITQYAWYKFGW